MRLIIATCLLASVALAAPVIETKSANVRRNRDTALASESTNSFADCISAYKENKRQADLQLDQYTNHMAQLEIVLASGPDWIAMTNAIAACSGVSKTAFNKMVDYVTTANTKRNQAMNDLKAVGANLKQALQDLKDSVVAEKKGK